QTRPGDPPGGGAGGSRAEERGEPGGRGAPAARRGEVGFLQPLTAVSPEQNVARRYGVARRIVEDAARTVRTEGFDRIRRASHEDPAGGGRDVDCGHRDGAARRVMAECLAVCADRQPPAIGVQMQRARRRAVLAENHQTVANIESRRIWRLIVVYYFDGVLTTVLHVGRKRDDGGQRRIEDKKVRGGGGAAQPGRPLEGFLRGTTAKHASF